MEKSKDAMMKLIDCDDIGDLQEYVGCKVEHGKGRGMMKLTQLALIQSFQDEFGLEADGMKPRTPAVPGEVLQKGDKRNRLSHMDQGKYRSGVGKLLHMMRWSRPDVMNAVRETSKFMQEATG